MSFEKRIESGKEGMFNEKGELVDLYIPRKCSQTNRILDAKDKASVQINVGQVDETTGKYTGKNLTYGFSGFLKNYLKKSSNKINKKQGSRK